MDDTSSMTLILPLSQSPYNKKFELQRILHSKHNYFESISVMNTNPVEKEYVIHENTIRFSTQFDQCLSLYHNLLLMVTHVEFEDNFGKRSQFNNYFPALKNIVSIIFGYSFNKPFVLTKYMIHLSFGLNFNQPIVLSKNIKYLLFSSITSYFNQPVDLSKNLVVLRISTSFNQSLILTKKIKSLSLKYGSLNNPIILPKHLYEISLNHYSSPFVLNKTMKRLELRCHCTRVLILDPTTNIKILYPSTDNLTRDNLPDSVSEICEFRPFFSEPLPRPTNNFPNRLVKIMANEYYEQQFVHLRKKEYQTPI